jgi:hypothetical protein
VTQPNPEKPVLDDIDELIASELDEHGNPLDDFRSDRYPRCERCLGHWHGLPAGGCPGAFGDDVKPLGDLFIPVEPILLGEYTFTMLVRLDPDGGPPVFIAMLPDDDTELECAQLTFNVPRATLTVQLMPDSYQYVPLNDSEFDTPESGDVAP